MTALLIHGFNATPDQHWYSAIRPLLESVGINYLAPTMPNAGSPQKEEWVSTIKSAYKTIDGEVILVGHSLGTRAALLFLEHHSVQVRGSLLVGAFSNDLENGLRRGRVYDTFFDHSIDLNLVKSRCLQFVVMHSRDDQSIPYEQGAQIALDLGAELVTETNYGHFTSRDDAGLIFKQIKRMTDG